VANLGILGCQKDHYHFSAAINGIFWFDPAIYSTIYRLLRSPIFGLDVESAKAMLQRCFSQESAGLHRSYQTHQEAMESYKAYLTPISYAWSRNREMAQESAGLHRSYQTHQEAMESYKVYLTPISYAWSRNREMALMAKNSIDTYLNIQRRSLRRVLPSLEEDIINQRPVEKKSVLESGTLP